MARLSGRAPQPGSKNISQIYTPEPAWATPEQIASVRSRLHSKEAVYWFDLVAEEARRSGTLTVVDLATFQHWADNQGVWEIATSEFHEWLRSLPPVTKETPKEASMFPRCYGLRNRAHAQARDLEAQLGFSPSARTRIRAAQSQADMFDALPENLDEFLKKIA